MDIKKYHPGVGYHCKKMTHITYALWSTCLVSSHFTRSFFILEISRQKLYTPKLLSYGYIKKKSGGYQKFESDKNKHQLNIRIVRAL